MASTGASAVTVGRRDGRVLLGDAMPCGTRFCPNCGPRIQAQRREEIGGLVEAARSRGWAVLFLTLTIRHSRADALADLLDGLDVAWRAMTGGGFWTRLKRRHGLRHFVRVTEEQQGGQHGWHPHYHVLLLCDPAQAQAFDVDRLGDQIVAQWGSTVAAAGYSTSSQAQRLIEPTESHLDLMAAYFSKQLASDLAWELTGQATKSTHGESRNPAQLLDAAVSGDHAARAAWVELEQATAGRRLIAYSAHARDELRLPPTVRSSAAATEEPPTPAESLVCIPRAAWTEHAARFGFRHELAIVVEGGATADELLWWLRDRGCHAWIVQSPPPTPERRPPELGPPGQEWLALPDGGGGF